MGKKLLVIGAQPQSIGAHVAYVAQRTSEQTNSYTEVRTAGITKDHDIHLDVTDPDTWTVAHKFEHIVCTAGINAPSDIGDLNFRRNLHGSMMVNALGPLGVLEQWLFNMQTRVERQGPQSPDHAFVVVSSNSAHIARSGSAAYCASKAALSMGVRCLARQAATLPVSVYAFEPGWVVGTPMSEDVSKRLGSDDPAVLHRIPGYRALTPSHLAMMILDSLQYPWCYNGTTIRIDGGEQ